MVGLAVAVVLGTFGTVGYYPGAQAPACCGSGCRGWCSFLACVGEDDDPQAAIRRPRIRDGRGRGSMERGGSRLLPGNRGRARCFDAAVAERERASACGWPSAGSRNWLATSARPVDIHAADASIGRRVAELGRISLLHAPVHHGGRVGNTADRTLVAGLALGAAYTVSAIVSCCSC